MNPRVSRRTQIFAATLLLAGGTGAGIANVRADALDARMHALLDAHLVAGAQVGIDVMELTPRGPVERYAHEATTPLGPASNCKLLTTAAAFARYGPKASFKTQLFKVGDDLVLVGGGDPALGDAKLYTGKTPITAPFDQFAAALKKAHITSYRDLLVDDRIFDAQWVNPDWPADQRLHEYEAGIAGLNFNRNCLDWLPTLAQNGAVGIDLSPKTSYVHITIKATHGSATRVSLLRPSTSNTFEMRGTVARNPSDGADPYSAPIYDPGLWTGTILRDVLASNGISGGGAGADGAPGEIRRVGPTERVGPGILVATYATPLLAVLKRANTDSINMMAEGLCKRLGHDATGEPGSWKNGTAAVEAFAQSIGCAPSWITLHDGSGLSSKDKVAPKAFTTVLACMAARPDGDAFINTLARPGEDGTLRRRFKGMPVADAIHAKTGHISGVSTLSGIIDAGGRRFAFSILVNHYKGNVNPWQDQVCQAIYAWATTK